MRRKLKRNSNAAFVTTEPLFLIGIIVSLVLLVAVALDVPSIWRGPTWGNWRWTFQPKPISSLGVTAIPCAFFLIVILAVSGGEWAKRRPKLAARALLLTAILFGFGFHWGLTKPVGKGSVAASLVQRTADSSFTSYYSVARMDWAESPRGLYANYNNWSRGTDLYRYLHAVTHPPGAVLFYALTMDLCEMLPPLTDALAGAASRAGISESEFQPHLSRSELAAALLAPILLMLLNLLACWPIARLAQILGHDPVSSARIAAIWPLIPGSAVTTSQLDSALALPIAGLAALLMVALDPRHHRTTGIFAAVLAGVIAGVATNLTYGAIAFFAIAVIVAFMSSHNSNDSPLAIRRLGIAAAIAALSFLAPFILSPANPLAIFRTALSNHHLITADRSYLTWLLFNPLDFILLCGVPLIVMFITSSQSEFSRGVLLGLGLLTLSGSVRGEVGRIWVPLMPLILAGAWKPGNPIARSQAAILGTLLALFALMLRLRWQIP